MRTLPVIAILLGAAGLVPFLLCGYAALAIEGEWSRIGLLGLSAYGACILSFLGGVHWGFGLSPGGGTAVVGAGPGGVGVQVAGPRGRFVLGVVPALLGWVALLITFAGLPKTGLLVLTAGFIGTTIAEARGARAGLVPAGYMALRWVLSVVVIICLVSVCLVLALGGRVVL